MPAPPAGASTAQPRRREPTRGRRAIILVFAGLVLVSGVVGAWLGAIWNTGPSSVGPSASSVSSAAPVAAAVVNINTYAAPFGGTNLSPLGAGTGMVITPSGEVLTNNHVVQGAVHISVTIPGRPQPVDANVVGVDPTDDVALLQLQGVSGLPTVTVGSPDALSVGQQVTAIGNALGKGGAPAVTSGSVSALHRAVTANDPSGPGSEHLHDVIVTDAPIVPGDSGGALVDGSGKVVGMITAGQASSAPGAPHVGFAIPVDNALSIVNQIRSGQAGPSILLGQRGFLGVAVQPLDHVVAARLGVANGVAVIGVDPNGPAATIGMRTPAVITQVDGHAITDLTDLSTYLHAHMPGERAQVTWVDAHGTHRSTATFTTGPAV
jgi:S1-C subfamily serine protease